MGVLSRMFRRQRQPAAPVETERTAALAALAEGLAGVPTGDEPPVREVAGEVAAADAPRPGEEPERTEVPLRSLQRYRQDPAFKKFMAKAQKKPGAADRRPGIPSDYFDREQRPR